MNTHTKGILIAVFGVACLSFDALFIRLINADNWNIFFWYNLFSAIFFTIYLFKKYKLKLFTLFLQNYKIFLIFGSISAFSGLCFISSIIYTQTANTVLIISTGSFMTGIISYITLKEYTPLRVWISSIIAIIGVLWIFF
jgi:drug/metabolite transporter (DMT)-like permease